MTTLTDALGNEIKPGDTVLIYSKNYPGPGLIPGVVMSTGKVVSYGERCEHSCTLEPKSTVKMELPLSEMQQQYQAYARAMASTDTKTYRKAVRAFMADLVLAGAVRYEDSQSAYKADHPACYLSEKWAPLEKWYYSSEGCLIKNVPIETIETLAQKRGLKVIQHNDTHYTLYPATVGEVKAIVDPREEVLAALKAGDLDKAWQLYCEQPGKTSEQWVQRFEYNGIDLVEQMDVERYRTVHFERLAETAENITTVYVRGKGRQPMTEEIRNGWKRALIESNVGEFEMDW